MSAFGQGKISAQPHPTSCIQFLDRENNDKNNTLPLGKKIYFIIVWGCAKIFTSGSIRRKIFRRRTSCAFPHAQGILHPKDKKRANNQQNNAPSPLTETKGISKTFMTIRDGKYVILSYMPTILKCVGNQSPNVVLSNQAYSFIRKQGRQQSAKEDWRPKQPN